MPFAAATIRRIKRYLIALAIPSLALAGQAHAASPCPPGFAALQASDTCVRISGRAVAEAAVGLPRARSSNAVEARAGGRVQLDVRKPTEYGPLRVVIRAEVPPR